ncbi:MAG: hypothetical protein K2M02_06070 [Duncaniella sp.]|nr:hypothetical protein [Duncaniella sp.]
MTIKTLASFAALLLTASCGSPAATVNEKEEADASELRSGDLAVFELCGRVRNVTKTTYYNVTLIDGDSLSIDTNAVNRIETKIYFDSLGHYVKRRNERIERDSEGRIIKWSDGRPNIKGLHGGFLRDTLRYNHVSENLVESSGMGQFATTIYDDNHRIIGQYTNPLSDKNSGDIGSCFNIYRAEDDRGNWTERLTVWVTQGKSESPHVSYTVDTREIIYY